MLRRMRQAEFCHMQGSMSTTMLTEILCFGHHTVCLFCYVVRYQRGMLWLHLNTAWVLAAKTQARTTCTPTGIVTWLLYKHLQSVEWRCWNHVFILQTNDSVVISRLEHEPLQQTDKCFSLEHQTAVPREEDWQDSKAGA